jgi:phage terminase large subunit
MRVVLSRSFYPLLARRDRYLVLVGGGGSGKSEFAARKLAVRSQTEGRHRWLVMRKIRRTLADSVIAVVRSVLAENEIPHTYNKSERKIEYIGPCGPVEYIFEGMDDPEKIKSIKGITGVWLEETTEFSKDEFLQIDLRLREPGPNYHQIICSFNPVEAEAPWLKEMFFDRIDPSAFVHHSTVDDNPIAAVRAEYAKRLDALADKDEAFYSIYRLGKWASPQGRIFQWDVVPGPPAKFDEIIYGGDFGYSIDPAAVVRIYRRADEYWVEVVIYQTGLTNQGLATLMGERGVTHDAPIYFDSAEPKSIAEIQGYGFNACPADKGPDSVRSGIDKMKSMKIHIIAGSQDLVNEVNRYHWRKDKSGRPMAEPVNFDNHAIDATRYGIISNVKHSGIVFGVLKHDIRPR